MANEHCGEDLGHRPEHLASLVRLIADRTSDPGRHKTKICVFLGAGADISSGGLSFVDLKKQAIEEFSHKRVFDVTQPDQLEEQFEEMFARLQPDERALLIEFLFRRMDPLNPSDSYKLLVLLAEAGGVDSVVTTNFDLMLERAQSQLGRDLFQVFAPGFARPYLISYSRFELPKKPYLKLHGDIASRTVVSLTSSELEKSAYDASMLELLAAILESHDLILVGYSGWDPALARIIGDAVDRTTNRVFWCNPHAPSPKSPLFERLGNRVRIVNIKFDDLMEAVGRPVLERPSLIPTEPTYVRCLFDWRVDYCNREYVHMYGERSGKSLVDVFTRRKTIEDRLASFLMPNHPLAIIAGPSGYGKTTIGIRLHKAWQADSSTRILLIRSKTLPASADVEQYICEQLGGLGARTPFSFFRLERWLAESGLRLVLFIDGINEFSPDLARCVQLLRNILRFCYFLPEADSALRVIVTVRQETWESMLPHLDFAQVRKALWVENSLEESLSTIACTAFTDDELSDAVARLRAHGYANISIDRLAPGVLDQLRDPYLLGIVADSAHQGLPSIPSAGIYQRAFETKLRLRGPLIDVATLKDILASLALSTLSSQQDRFRETDISPPSLRGEVIRLMKDLHVFVDAGSGFLQFDHDRTLEYFLALGLASGRGPRLETMQELRDYLRNFRTQSKAIAAAKLYFQLAPRARFALIAEALQLLDRVETSYSLEDIGRLFRFGREVLVEMAEQGEPLAEEYIHDVLVAGARGKAGEHHLRAAVQSAANVQTERAIQLLALGAHVSSRVVRTEANIYAIDKLVKLFLLSGGSEIDLLEDEPYATFFADRSLGPWQKATRLLSFASQLGPDNTCADEYARIYASLSAGLAKLLNQRPWAEGSEFVKGIVSTFLQDCDRLLFNATPRGINRFFGNPRRAEFLPLIEKLANGSVLEESDLIVFEPYTQSLNCEIEYHLSHLLFVFSSINGLEPTLHLAEKRLNTFCNATAPEEVDFFHAVLVYIHVLHNLTYDPARFGVLEERVLRDWPDVLLYRPGVERGERRGFIDLFDRIFEDGFDVIFPYGVLLPSRHRRSLKYVDYRRDLASEQRTHLPLYTKYLHEFLRAGKIEESIQLLHAIAGVIVVWPTEGLQTIGDVVGYPEPRIRRATVRILAEAFNRHPEETLQFLKTSGAAVTDEDLTEIKIRQDARIGRRQINEEEWARLGHFLFKRGDAQETFLSCIRTVIQADSLEDAAAHILRNLGIIGYAER